MKYKDIKEGMVVAVKTGNHYLHRTMPDLVRATIVSTDRYANDGFYGTRKRENGNLVEVECSPGGGAGCRRHVTLGQIKGEWDPVGIQWEADIAKLNDASDLRREVAKAARDLALRLARELTALGYPTAQTDRGLSMNTDTATKLIADLSKEGR